MTVFLLVPGAALAHSGTGSSGFYAGFFHPVLGYDHLIAMICVGIVSAQIGGKAIWTVPATFVGVMATGGVLGMNGVVVPFVEYGIVISVIALGAAIAAEKHMGLFFTHSVVGRLGLFHGHAHGLEMPTLADPAMYALGFSLSTAILHLLGVGIGLMSAFSRRGALVLRNCGALITVFGFYLIIDRLPFG